MLRKVNGKDVLVAEKLNWLTINSFLKTALQKMAIIVSVKSAETRRKENNYGIKAMCKMRKDDG